MPRQSISRVCRAGALGWIVSLAIASVVPGRAQSEPVIYHDLSAMKAWPLGKMQVRGAMGQMGSMALVELPEGFRQTPHHHAQEQIVVGVTGMTEMSVGGALHRLGTYGAVLTPRDVQHGNGNGGAGEATFIEFQPVLRTDWFPPHQKFVPAVPAAATPVSPPPDRQVFADFAMSSEGWVADDRGVRSKSLAGNTIAVRIWDVSARSSSAQVLMGAVNMEHFIYVLEGQVEVVSRAHRRKIGAGMLAIVSPLSEDVQLGSLGAGRSVVAVFSATAG